VSPIQCPSCQECQKKDADQRDYREPMHRREHPSGIGCRSTLQPGRLTPTFRCLRQRRDGPEPFPLDVSGKTRRDSCGLPPCLRRCSVAVFVGYLGTAQQHLRRVAAISQRDYASAGR